MRLLIATQSYHPGTNGQASFTIRLAEGLAQLRHSVAVIMPSTQRHASRETIRGVRVYGLAARHVPQIHPALYVAIAPEAAIGRVLSEFQPELVHLQDHYLLSESVLRAARTRGLPVVGTNHFLPDNLLANFFPAITLRPGLHSVCTRVLWGWLTRVYDQLDAITTPTETAARILRREALQVPITAISCGVDVQRFRPLPDLHRAALRARYGVPVEATTFLYVGRIDREKRLDVMLRAFAAVGDTQAHLVIGGRGPAEAELRGLSGELGVGERVTFAGYVPAEDLPALLNSADCFVMPSPQELQSIATIEAMATGRPVLAAEARALPELVTHGVNGYLFAPNCVADAAAWMRAFATVPQRWAAFGAASLERARRHSLYRTLHAYESLYSAVVAAQQPAHAPSYGYSIDTV